MWLGIDAACERGRARVIVHACVRGLFTWACFWWGVFELVGFVEASREVGECLGELLEGCVAGERDAESWSAGGVACDFECGC